MLQLALDKTEKKRYFCLNGNTKHVRRTGPQGQEAGNQRHGVYSRGSHADGRCAQQPNPRRRGNLGRTSPQVEQDVRRQDLRPVPSQQIIACLSVPSQPSSRIGAAESAPTISKTHQTLVCF